MNIAKVAAWSIIEPASGFSNFKKHYLICYLLGCWGVLFWITVLSVLSIQKPVLCSLKRNSEDYISVGREHKAKQWNFLPCVPSAQQLSSKVIINITKFCRSNWQQNKKPFPRDFTVKRHCKRRVSFRVHSYSVDSCQVASSISLGKDGV